MGSHYDTIEKDVTSVRLDVEAERLKSARLEKEKKALGGKLFPPSGGCMLFFSF